MKLKKVFFDKFHYNQAAVVWNQYYNDYYIILKNTLFYLKLYGSDMDSIPTIEKILGSIDLAKNNE